MNLFFKYLLLFIFTTSANLIHAQDAYDLTRQMFERTKSISTLKYKMTKRERINGSMVEQQSISKLNRNPLKVYVKQLYPKEGVEVLFVEGKNDNNALINPNGFPWFNLRLDPLSSIVRKDQHHTLFESGFDHVVNILEFLFDKYGEETRSMVSSTDTVFMGKACVKVSFQNPNFQYINYTIEEGENLDIIAKRLMISQYMIIEKNPGIDDVNDVSAGQIIQVPNAYSSGMELYIDKKNLIPLIMKVYDDQGLYEHYEYSQVEIDPVFDASEFSEHYEAYGF